MTDYFLSSQQTLSAVKSFIFNSISYVYQTAVFFPFLIFSLILFQNRFYSLPFTKSIHSFIECNNTVLATRMRLQSVLSSLET